jgi:hypothetical protein
MSRRAGVLVPAWLLLVALAGCAGVPPYGAGRPASPPAPGAKSGPTQWVTSSPLDTIIIRKGDDRVAATPDSAPSRDALDVLATIPEPLAPGERVPPAAAAAVAADADTGAADVPVPALTPVLGDRPLPEVAASTDTTPPPAAPVPRALLEPQPMSGPGTPAVSDTCWRVQIAAWADRKKAERYLEAGRSQLPVPLVIETEKGLFKVRTRDCLNGQDANGLRRRAQDAGFDGAFRFRGRRP